MTNEWYRERNGISQCPFKTPKNGAETKRSLENLGKKKKTKKYVLLGKSNRKNGGTKREEEKQGFDYQDQSQAKWNGQWRKRIV